MKNIPGTLSLTRDINRKIKDFSKKSVIDTDEIWDGKNTFFDLYSKIFELEQELKKCQEFKKEVYY